MNQIEISLADKKGEFARVVESLIKSGFHIKSAALTYDGHVLKGALPTAHFTVSSTHEEAAQTRALEPLGGRRLQTKNQELKIKPKSLGQSLRELSASGSMCSFFYIDRGDPEAYASVSFFQT